MPLKKLDTASLEQWVAQSSYVFRGRILALGKCNLTGVEPEPNMVTVKVEEVIVAPPDLGNITGSTVTVYFQSTSDLKAGQPRTIFASGWHLGKTIGVTEVGSTSLDAAEVRAMVTAEQLRQLDAKLEERIKGAHLIVSGKVLACHRATAGESFPGMDEGVEWWEAEMYVRTVEKGSPTAELSCYYPVGGENEWAFCPKCQPDQEGVWLLRPVEEYEDRGEKKKKGGTKAGEDVELMAFDPLDYHSISALPRIQSLIWRMGKK